MGQILVVAFFRSQAPTCSVLAAAGQRRRPWT